MPNTNGHGPKLAILYARVSTDEQARSGYSLAQQLEALREYAAREGYEVLEEVVDPGQSGAKPGEARHGPYEGLGGGWWRLSGTSSGPRPLRPRASLSLPLAAGVRGAWLQDTRSQRPWRRLPGGGADRWNFGSTSQVRARQDCRANTARQAQESERGEGRSRPLAALRFQAECRARWLRGGRREDGSGASNLPRGRGRRHIPSYRPQIRTGRRANPTGSEILGYSGFQCG